jgi:glutaconate CoA-transferase subunit A
VTKLTTLREAVATYVAPGRSIYITGFTHLIGFASAHEIIRQRIRHLTLIRMTPDLVYDQLVGADCADHLVFSYLGNPGIGSLHIIKRAIERGQLTWTEYTHGSLIAALRAGASGAPFAVATAIGTSDLKSRNPLVRTVHCPYTNQEVCVVPPLRPDVALVHVQRADAEGNAQAWGSVGEIAEAAFASKHVIVTAEEIVAPEVIRADPNRTLLPGFIVDAVVHQPWGAHPSYAQGYYARDNRFYRKWSEISRDDTRFTDYLRKWVHDEPDRTSYAKRLGDDLARLRAVGDGWSPSVNYGSNAALAAAQD